MLFLNQKGPVWKTGLHKPHCQLQWCSATAEDRALDFSPDTWCSRAIYRHCTITHPPPNYLELAWFSTDEPWFPSLCKRAGSVGGVAWQLLTVCLDTRLASSPSGSDLCDWALKRLTSPLNGTGSYWNDKALTGCDVTKKKRQEEECECFCLRWNARTALKKIIQNK